MTKQHRRTVFKNWRAAVATKTRDARQDIPATTTPKDRVAAIQAATHNEGKILTVSTPTDDHQDLIEALGQLSEAQAESVIARARAHDRAQKQQRAADKVREYLHGHEIGRTE